VLFVGGHELGRGKPGGLALGEQLGPGAEGVGQALGMAGCIRPCSGSAVEHTLACRVDHKTTAHRVVLTRSYFVALRVKRVKRHAVGVQRQAFAAEQQVLFFDKRHWVLAQQGQCLPGADAGNGGLDLVGVYVVGLVPGQAQQHGLVGAVAHTRGRQGAKQFHRDVVHGGQAQGALHMAGKLPRRNHGPHGVGAGRADTDLEEVENADGHGGCVTGRASGQCACGAGPRVLSEAAWAAAGGGEANRTPHLRHARYPCPVTSRWSGLGQKMVVVCYKNSSFWPLMDRRWGVIVFDF